MHFIFYVHPSVNLKWDDVDPQTGRIVIQETKNGERRTVPLSGIALEKMKEYGKNKRSDTDSIFPGNNLQKPVDIRRSWGNVIKKTAIKDFHFHDLRHTAAPYLAMNGATTADMAEIPGHNSTEAVKRYTHLSESRIARIVESMNEKLLSEQPLC